MAGIATSAYFSNVSPMGDTWQLKFKQGFIEKAISFEPYSRRKMSVLPIH